jgi:ABC-type sugar transport system substrate-binding protein
MPKTQGRIAGVIAILLTALLLAGCGGGSPNSAGSTGASAGANSSGDASAAGKKVILLTVTTSCDYCRQHLDAFQAEATKQGLQVDVKTTDYDAAEQAQQVDQAIAQKPDGIVLWPADANAIVPSLNKIHKAGIPLVVSNSLPDQKNEELWDVYTGPNDEAEGESAATAMLQGFKEKGISSGGIIGILGVPGTPPAINRLAGFKKVLEQQGQGFSYFGDQPGNWDQTQATSAAAGLFTANAGNNVVGVFSEADNMAAGAIVAAQRSGITPSKAVFVGVNWSPEGVSGINAGDQYATVLQSPVLDGQYAATAIADVLAGKQVEKTQFLPAPIITKGNVADCASTNG